MAKCNAYGFFVGDYFVDNPKEAFEIWLEYAKREGGPRAIYSIDWRYMNPRLRTHRTYDLSWDVVEAGLYGTPEEKEWAFSEWWRKVRK